MFFDNRKQIGKLHIHLLTMVNNNYVAVTQLDEQSKGFLFKHSAVIKWILEDKTDYKTKIHF